MLIRHSSCLRMDLRWFQDRLSSSRVDELLQLLITILNSFFENGGQLAMGLSPILSRTLMSTWQSKALLKNEWSTVHKLSSERYRRPLCLMVSIAGSFLVLTQFINFQGPWLLLAISWILLSKNILLVVLTVCLNDFQSSRFLDSLYFLKDQLQSSFHHFLECLVILMFLVLNNHICSILVAKELMVYLGNLRFIIDKVLRALNMLMISLTKISSSLLFFGILSFKE